MNEDLMLVIDRIVDAGGDWPSPVPGVISAEQSIQR